MVRMSEAPGLCNCTSKKVFTKKLRATLARRYVYCYVKVYIWPCSIKDNFSMMRNLCVGYKKPCTCNYF